MKRYIFLILVGTLTASLLCAKDKQIMSPEDAYELAMTALQKKNWKEVVNHSKSIIDTVKESPFLSDFYFLAGVGYFNQRDYDIANTYFSKFLEKFASPKHFEEALVYKFQIAENFEEGMGKHLMGWEKLPKVASAWEDAYQIYDEVINTLSRHEVAAKALFRKAGMLKKDKKYPESIETYQILIRRFPKHPLTPEAYLSIAHVYLEESKSYFADRDFLEQARLNLKKFGHDFPREERVLTAEAMLRDMMDYYAKELWDSAHYYQKKRKFQAAELYYQSLLKKYPESHFAEPAFARLEELKRQHPDRVEKINAAIITPQ